ncbi:hypothetical protein [Nocardia sp. NPDC051832]|uniref:LppU/SCO3897 family protein n=1 Tax=Nocardia sp. NPDC051832 TaxID=3155673 RepID=UPI003443C921
MPERQMSTPPNFPYQGHYPPPPPPVFRPPAPSGRERVMSWVMVLAPAVVLFLLAGVVWLVFGTVRSAEVGQCGTLSGSSAVAEFEIADCADPDANYVVAEKFDQPDSACATKDYTSYYREGWKGYTLCLRLNAAEGDCFSGGPARASTKVECAGSADFKVDKIVHGVAATSACGPVGSDENTYLYPAPEPLTFCLAAPK